MTEIVRDILFYFLIGNGSMETIFPVEIVLILNIQYCELL